MSDFSFSKRTNWSLQSNALSILQEGLQTQDPILDLTESNPTHGGFDYPPAWLQYLSHPANLLYAPESQGLLQARKAVQDYYAQQKLKVETERLLLTSSTSEGYSFLLKLLTNPGDHVLVPKPSYPLFQFLLELHDVTVDYYPLVYDGHWKMDQEAFKHLITPHTKAVILVNPNNPTCSYTRPEDLIFLNEQCFKHKMAIISDEVFLDYKIDEHIQARSFVENAQALTFVLSGLSKILGLPQMKLSWIAANGPAALVQQAMEKLDIIADTYLSVNTPVQNACIHWLPEAKHIQSQILKRVKGNLEILLVQGFKVLPVEGGWYAVIEAAIPSEEEFVLNLLKEDNILVHPGFFFDFEREGYLVLSLLPSPEVFKKASEQIFKKLKLL